MLLLGAAAIYVGTAEALMHVFVADGSDPDTGDLDVYLVSNGVHVDVWVPASHPARDWSTWLPKAIPVNRRGYVSLGWGDEGFYTQVPTWGDLTVGVAARAVLWPSSTVVRASARYGKPDEGDSVHRIRITNKDYARLVEFIERSLDLSEGGQPVLLDHPGYGANDRFLRGSGSYSLFRTCNVWTGEALRAMGARAPRWTPLERNVRYLLPKNRGAGPG